MDYEVVRDFLSFGASITSGFFIGVLFDLYRAFRYISKPKKILSYIEDLLFWIIVVIIFFVLLVETTEGILRGFIFIGFFCGGALYILILSKYLLSIFIKIFELIIELFSEIIKVIFYPFRKVFTVSKGKIKKILLLPKVFLKEVGRYRKIISKKK